MTTPNQLRERSVLAGTWPTEHAAQIEEHGWSVVNAPRPLTGLLTWEGEFRAGIFYAAGPMDAFAERWRADDATLLLPITPADIVAKLRAACADHDTTLEKIAASYGGAAQDLAQDFDLPWDDAWLTTSAMQASHE